MSLPVMNLPPQQIPFSKKTKKWRKQVMDWANSKTYFSYSPVRKSVHHKKINYDLLNGKMHMADLELIINPEKISAEYIPTEIQHYPIMNSKLEILHGEELKRPFEYRIVVTNPTAISAIETEKKNELMNRLQEILSQTSESDEQTDQRLQELNKYYDYEWQDMREIRANALLNHYNKEYNMPLIFNEGFMDGLTVGEEIYQWDIVGGEPVISRINPMKIRIFKSGYSNKIEDADIVMIEDFWSPGQIIDTFYDVLTEKDMKTIESMPDYIGHTSSSSIDDTDERYGLIRADMIDENMSVGDSYFNPSGMFDAGINNMLMPYDMLGNIRVLRVYWKSRRKIKKVKYYTETGDVAYKLRPEQYKINKDEGEEEKTLWVNEAWEGTLIGNEIYVNIRPRPVQYNRLSNPSRCHFGIIGSIYNLNNSKPFSLVDKMKVFNYYYDVIHDRLNKLIASNWGKLLEVDLAKVPTGWKMDKWLNYAVKNKLAVIDSFKEGNIGAATGKLAGGLNNASRGMIDLELGNSIQMYINLLEFIKMELSEVTGISKQREGQISNRETVGGVERATLQSSHITEWFFAVHDDIKRRVYEAGLETAKIALAGTSKKFEYILPNETIGIMTIDGDEFAECDYGLVCDNNNSAKQFENHLDMLAQAALQNQRISLSTIAKLYSSISLSEKQKLIERSEREAMENAQKAQQEQMQFQQQQQQLQLQLKQAEIESREKMNTENNEVKLMLANIQKMSGTDDISEPYSQEAKDKLKEQIREFDAKLKLDKEKLELEKKKVQSQTTKKDNNKQ